MANSNMNNILKSVEEYYIKKDFDKSLDILLNHKNDLEKGLFHYNLGAIYLKKGQLGAARYNLEKAKKDGFSYGGLYKNLEFIENSPGVVSYQDSHNFSFFKTALSYSKYEVSFVTLLVISVLLIFFSIKKVKISARYVALVFILFLPAIFSFYTHHSFKQAVILQKNSRYDGPSKSYDDLGEVPVGSKVIIGREYGEWGYVSFPESYSGWIKMSKLGIF